MSQYFFTADTHFGHAAIIRHCQRPFKSIEEMDDTLVANWNSMITPEDIVYFLGDFAWRNIGEYTKRLNGNIHLIRGSHDKQIGNFSTQFVTVSDLKSVVIEGIRLVLAHYAMRVWDASHFNSWQLYGHSHCRLKAIGKQLDVGVDGHGFFPWRFGEIKEYMKMREDNPNYVGRVTTAQDPNQDEDKKYLDK